MTHATTPTPQQTSAPLSLFELAGVLLRRWRLVVGLPLVASVTAVGISLLLPERFTASVSFIPESEPRQSPLPGSLSNLAAQFGVSLPGGQGNSSEFYASVLQSRTIRDNVLLSSFADPRSGPGSDSAMLLDLLSVKGEVIARRLESGREALADRIVTINVDTETKVVNLAVETRYRDLSAALANRMITLLNQFNLETRRSSAKERREFVEGRVSEAERDLLLGEDQLKSFLENNRRWENSPELRFEHDRLQRQVLLKQEVLSTLQRLYEDARIQEVNDTPVITVIDQAVPPVENSYPRRKLIVVLAAFIGGVTGTSVALAREVVNRARVSDSEGYEDFSAQWGKLKADVRSLVRRPRSL